MTSELYESPPNDNHNGRSVPWITGDTGTMFRVRDQYLQRSIDYGSVLGELLRNHLGSTQDQLERIIPGSANPPKTSWQEASAWTEPPLQVSLASYDQIR